MCFFMTPGDAEALGLLCEVFGIWGDASEDPQSQAEDVGGHHGSRARQPCSGHPCVLVNGLAVAEVLILKTSFWGGPAAQAVEGSLERALGGWVSSGFTVLGKGDDSVTSIVGLISREGGPE